MKTSDRSLAVSILALLLLFWLGFLIHTAPRFAGSAWGGLFGVTAALFMLVPLAYTVAKRNSVVRRWVTAHYSIGSLLKLHVYFGLVGAFLALVHSGHNFQSVLGIGLTAALLLTVLSGFIGQYYLRYVAENIREKRSELSVLWRTLEIRSQSLASGPLEPSISLRAAAEILPVATATAELQYSVQFQERVRRLFSVWLKLHIICSVIFYVLLMLHIWSGIYFGLRWFK